MCDLLDSSTFQVECLGENIDLGDFVIQRGVCRAGSGFDFSLATPGSRIWFGVGCAELSEDGPSSLALAWRRAAQKAMRWAIGILMFFSVIIVYMAYIIFHTIHDGRIYDSMKYLFVLALTAWCVFVTVRGLLAMWKNPPIVTITRAKNCYVFHASKIGLAWPSTQIANCVQPIVGIVLIRYDRPRLRSVPFSGHQAIAYGSFLVGDSSHCFQLCGSYSEEKCRAQTQRLIESCRFLSDLPFCDAAGMVRIVLELPLSSPPNR